MASDRTGPPDGPGSRAGAGVPDHTGAPPARPAVPPGDERTAVTRAARQAAESLQSLTPELVRRLPQVLEAMVAIGQDVDLRSVLDRSVQTAAALTGARHAAIGVLGAEADGLPGFFTHGDAAVIRGRIGGGPNPHFLSVPIRVLDEPFGHLYLCDKAEGRPFTDADVHLVRVVATEAGIAVGHARLLESARQRARWIDGSAALTTALLRGTQDALSVVAEQARKLADAAAGLVLMPDAEGGLEIVAAAADDPAELLGVRVPPHSPLVAALLTGESVYVEDSATDPRLTTHVAARFGPSMMLPLGNEGRILGTLALPRSPGAPPFTATERTLARRFASQAALALLLIEAQRDRERLAVYEDRDRIARDLHDLVIQRLFATGMLLESVRRRAAPGPAPDSPAGAEPPEYGRRIEQAMDELDLTIREIRGAIYALQQDPAEQAASLRTRLLREVGTAALALGFQPGVTFTGPVDSLVGERTGRDLVAAAREALSNAVRHAGASRIELTADVTGTLPDGRPAVRLTVADDGVGLPSGGRRSGLTNLRRRAEELGGTSETGPGLHGRGTAVRWAAPL
ncbi:GAF domain-containing protein [Streptomyces sp. JJ66]|uniref:sensor histidine kinase n=1 Tax=Streptomyces sp. JJ66 TaxID=2803843 RepID=UPI001C57AF5F|nr:GAF domain-containing protein [Streptomyces sp. JJ66]MBW1601716.1 GAF domain-containing protein [Streptomyces sp. JJ66]